MINMMLRYGVSEKEYKRCLPQIRRNNKLILGVVSIVLSLSFLGLILLEGINAYFPLRTAVCAISVVLSVLIWRRRLSEN
jgi:hypothetical protein